MKIGIDIDNVIANFDDTLLKEYLKHDKTLRNKGIIEENAKYLRHGMFDWSKEEEQTFYQENIESFAKKLKTITKTKRRMKRNFYHIRKKQWRIQKPKTANRRMAKK